MGHRWEVQGIGTIPAIVASHAFADTSALISFADEFRLVAGQAEDLQAASHVRRNKSLVLSIQTNGVLK
jgi:hypothetical protein